MTSLTREDLFDTLRSIRTESLVELEKAVANGDKNTARECRALIAKAEKQLTKYGAPFDARKTPLPGRR